MGLKCPFHRFSTVFPPFSTVFRDGSLGDSLDESRVGPFSGLAAPSENGENGDNRVAPGAPDHEPEEATPVGVGQALDSWTFGGKPRSINALGVHGGWTVVDGMMGTASGYIISGTALAGRAADAPRHVAGMIFRLRRAPAGKAAPDHGEHVAHHGQHHAIEQAPGAGHRGGGP